MEETYQLTSALRYLPHGKEIALITDARFSGVSTGACIGHVGPEALAGGPLGRLRDGDLIRIQIDRVNLTGAIDFIGVGNRRFDAEEGASILAARPPHPRFTATPRSAGRYSLVGSPAKYRRWHLGGCVYDVEKILERLQGK
jgi:xylonate dehydratase